MASGDLVPRTEDPAAPGPVTVLLHQAAEGAPGAVERLMGAVYDELRLLARAHMRGERSGHILQPTALVNEAWLRLLRADEVSWQGRAQFFRAAATAMRRILLDHARSRNALKRGDGGRPLEIASVAEALAQEDSSGFLALDEAMDHLAGSHPAAAEVVRLKFYAGLDSSAAAAVLGISERSVRRSWAFARGWLRERLEHEARNER